MRVTEQYDAVVVGAGISGLICGAILASKGLKTIIVEKAGQIGGRGRCIEHRGFKIQNAFRIQRIDHLRKAMDLVGLKLEFAQCPKPYLGFFNVVTNEYAELPEDLGAEFVPWLAKMGVPDGLLLEFIDAWQRLGSISENEVGEICSSGLSFQALMEKLDLSRPIREMLFDVTAWSAHGIARPDDYRAGHFLKIILPHYLASGGIEIFQGLPTDQAIVDGFAERFQKRGGCLALDTEAVRIGIENGRVTGLIARDCVLDDLRIIRSKVIISSLPVWQNLNLAGDSALGPRLAEALRRSRKTAGMAVGLWFGLKEQVSDLQLVIRLVAPNPLTGAQTQYRGGAWFPSNIAPGMAPDGKQLFVMETFKEAGAIWDWDGLDEKVAEFERWSVELFEALKKARICRRSLNDVVDWKKPAIYSPSWAGPQMGVEPLVEMQCAEIGGLYFIGDTVKVEAATMGYDLAAAAALEVSERIGATRQ